MSVTRSGVIAGIERVGVVGCGSMGSGIAEVCARAGLDVTVVERSLEAADLGVMSIARSLERAYRSGKLEATDKERSLDCIRMTTELQRLDRCQLVVEAIPEDQELKVALFRRLEQVLGEGDAIIASVTSSVPILLLGMATKRPERVVGMHFFQPVPVLNLIEIVPSLLTSTDTVEQVMCFASSTLGKRALRCKDRPGFIANALLVPYVLSAIRMLESGFATADDIDVGMVAGCNHPMGPLHLADLIGLDSLLAIAERMFDESRQPSLAAPSLLSRMVAAGLLGRKSERGFFSY